MPTAALLSVLPSLLLSRLGVVGRVWPPERLSVRACVCVCVFVSASTLNCKCQFDGHGEGE